MDITIYHRKHAEHQRKHSALKTQNKTEKELIESKCRKIEQQKEYRLAKKQYEIGKNFTNYLISYRTILAKY